MAPSLALRLDALADWRGALQRRVDDLAQFLGERDLTEGVAIPALLASLRERLANEKLVLAFVAEFSRGKSELINAIFFADTGRRILPATPGRTTMCPVELGWNGASSPELALLPLDTRLSPTSLADLKAEGARWRRMPLRLDDPEHLARSLAEVTRTEWVERARARALGLWSDERLDDNPPTDAEGRVEVPAWRHATINYPHPLLKQGLVVLDTPGLNAVGTEPELTLGLLPTAHATVFLLGADTGVTKSDLAMWRDQLGGPGPARFVVLNKVDTLEDPLVAPADVEAQIAAQQRETARMLDVDVDRVFPLSARRALAARVDHDDAALLSSRLPALESALATQLLPRRRDVLEQTVLDAVGRIEAQAARHVGDQRRHLAEQMVELRALRGGNDNKVRLMLRRVDAEMDEFEQCSTLLQAVRSVHARMLKGVLADLAPERLREEIDAMEREMRASPLHLGSRRAFVELCARLQTTLAAATRRNAEIREMLAPSFTRLNAEFGFSLAVGRPPESTRWADELKLVEANYVRYLGVTQALRLSQPRFMEQFRQMLVAKLRIVFEDLGHEIELWNKATSSQVEAQLRERRRVFRHRRETLERVRSAGGDLESRIAQLELQDRRLLQSLAHTRELAELLREQACSDVADHADIVHGVADGAAPRAVRREAPRASGVDLPLFDDAPPAASSSSPAHARARHAAAEGR